MRWLASSFARCNTEMHLPQVPRVCSLPRRTPLAPCDSHLTFVPTPNAGGLRSASQNRETRAKRRSRSSHRGHHHDQLRYGLGRPSCTARLTTARGTRQTTLEAVTTVTGEEDFFQQVSATQAPPVELRPTNKNAPARPENGLSAASKPQRRLSTPPRPRNERSLQGTLHATQQHDMCADHTVRGHVAYAGETGSQAGAGSGSVMGGAGGEVVVEGKGAVVEKQKAFVRLMMQLGRKGRGRDVMKAMEDIKASGWPPFNLFM